MKSLTGIVHGKTIELIDGPDLPEGQKVEIVLVRPTSAAQQQALSRCGGSLEKVWTSDDDRILDEIARERESASHRDLPE